MRFFCRGEIRRGKISVWCIEISREKYFCRVQICSINFFCLLYYVMLKWKRFRIETFSRFLIVQTRFIETNLNFSN